MNGGHQSNINQWNGNSEFQVLISKTFYHISISQYEKKKGKIVNAIMNKIEKSNGRFVGYHKYKKIGNN